jgi:predicted ATPase
MFLNSLPPSQVEKLSGWIEGLFGYGLSVFRSDGGGHLSINLVDHGVGVNIVDTGYGVSQILPVLAQVWWARERPISRLASTSTPTILAIEQPELHLHPAHQALLADAFVGEAVAENYKRERRVQFLIETHSETFINRLGELIVENRLSPDDVHIILFEADKENEKLTATSIATFSADGSLINWPFGFFQPTVA